MQLASTKASHVEVAPLTVEHLELNLPSVDHESPTEFRKWYRTPAASPPRGAPDP